MTRLMGSFRERGREKGEMYFGNYLLARCHDVSFTLPHRFWVLMSGK